MFQPSSALQRLLQPETPQETNKPVERFKLTSNYKRSQVQRAHSTEEIQDKSFEQFLGGGSQQQNRVIIVQSEILGASVTHDSTKDPERCDRYTNKIYQLAKYAQFLESRQIIKDLPNSAKDQEQDQKETVYMEVEKEPEMISDPEEYERLMKPNKMIQPNDQAPLDMMTALSEGQIILLQLPSTLPFEQVITSSKALNNYEAKDLDDKEQLMREYYLNEQYDFAGFKIKQNYEQIVDVNLLKKSQKKDIAEIRVDIYSFIKKFGKIVQDAQGNCLWQIADEQFMIQAGLQTQKKHEMVSISLEQEQFSYLGSVGAKFIATPDIQSLL